MVSLEESLKLLGIEKLNAECFRFDNWESNWWTVIDLEFSSSAKLFMTQISKFIVGWCEGSKLSVRPKESYYAVMLWKNEKEFWFHINDDMFERYFLDRDVFNRIYKY